MKTESTVKYVLRIALTLLAITAVVAVILATVNSVTAPRIAAQNEQKTQAAIEAVNYYGGMVAGLSAIFATTNECLGIPVTSIFDPSSLPDYASFDSRDCPLCKAGQRIDALVNSFGYSTL